MKTYTRKSGILDMSFALMKPQIKIRNVNEQDLASVTALINELEGTSFSEADLRPIFIQNLQDPHVFYLIACTLEGQVVGLISLYLQNLLHHAGKTGQVQELVVTEDFQDLGIGKMLLDQVEQIALNLDLTEIEVSSNRMRTRAHGFYQRNQYELSHFKFIKKVSLV